MTHISSTYEPGIRCLTCGHDSITHEKGYGCMTPFDRFSDPNSDLVYCRCTELKPEDKLITLVRQALQEHKNE